MTISLQERDKKHIWHPLTQHQTASNPIAIVKAKGALLWDESGKEYIDGIASWYTVMYGHCHHKIIAAVNRQIKQLDQVVFTGFTHDPAVNLSEKLIEILPNNQEKLFFNDNGSTSVEAGIKMAFQYHFNKGVSKDTIIAFENGFHGDTFGAMSTSGLSVYNGPFKEFFLSVKRIPVPKKENLEDVLSLLRKIISENKCAGFIYEPLVQGAAGMKFHDPNGLEKILKVCKSHQVLCIADEVMTGFGKTGLHFASLYLKTYPDIMCLSKSLTAGMVPMGITSSSQAVFDAFLDTKITKGFFHAHTYSANPLGCAVASAGVDLLTSKQIQRHIIRIQKQHQQFLTEIEYHPKVLNTRTLGVILALDLAVKMDRYGSLRDKMFNYLMEQGVFLRPLGNTIYILPPFVITSKQLKKIYTSIKNILNEPL